MTLALSLILGVLELLTPYINYIFVVWSLVCRNVLFVLSTGDLEEKQHQIKDLQLEVERLTGEHAKSAEQFSSEVSRIIKESEEVRQDLQAQFDATLKEKSREYEKLEEQFVSLKDINAREVCM